MKRELWDKVKVGHWVIYADEFDGVHKAKVTDVDIRILEEGEPSRWSYPYGFTKDTGIVKIRYEKTEIIENLQNLITFLPTTYEHLKKAWDAMKSAEASLESYRMEFLSMRTVAIR